MLEALTELTRGNSTHRRETLLRFLESQSVHNQSFLDRDNDRYINLSTRYTHGQPQERIAVSAHYDKVSLGQGALDNASGVIVLLSLLARLQKEKPKADVTFLFFDGEEDGCIGSRYFVGHNPLPFAAVYNLDVVGRGDSVVVARSSLDLHSKTFVDVPPFLIERVQNVCTLDDFPCYEIAQTPMSDHVPFNQSRIPAVWLCTLPQREATLWSQGQNFLSIPTFTYINGPKDTIDKIEPSALQLAHHITYHLLQRHFS